MDADNFPGFVSVHSRLFAAKYLSFFLLAATLAAAPPYDVVVYGATAGGVIAAVSAAREGLNGVLLEPGHHVGGMVTGGLSRTDYGKKEVIGGYALEFFWRMGLKYDLIRHGQEVSWLFEPHVAEQAFREMLDQSRVQVLYNHRLREKGGVSKDAARIVGIITEDGEVFTAQVFMDASYEGDLMAQAGVSYTVGRESSAQYGESLAGVRARTPLHQFLVNVSPYDVTHELLPEISADPPGIAGSADNKVQSYNFRMCLSSDPANQVPFPQPPGYSPYRYELLARLINAETEAWGRPLVLNDVTTVVRIPGDKTDINNRGAFSTDYIGKSWEYPEASYQRRAAIWEDHVNYTKGFFYFLANDPSVPAELRNDVNTWGLAKDEFVDTGNWPNQLYVREARRMVSDFVMTQKDLQTDLRKADVIGMGSYNSDSHNVYRFANQVGFAENEGDMQIGVTPYQIPYRIMVPKQAQATNLLVPVCFSASHAAYSSVRMEPQYMILGHAAGVAARLAIDENRPVQQIDVTVLQTRLRQQGAIFEYVPDPHTRTFDLLRKRPSTKP
jgi:hypothetical protein